jgi:hypothetical protein
MDQTKDSKESIDRTVDAAEEVAEALSNDGGIGQNQQSDGAEHLAQWRKKLPIGDRDERLISDDCNGDIGRKASH